MNKNKIHILFLCVANSARSQLAEGLGKNIFGDLATIESAGSEPSGKVQPWAIEVLRQDGIDISNNWSKSTDDLPLGFLSNLNYVITLCADEVCPLLPSKAKRLHWPIPDPAGHGGSDEEQLRRFRSARNEIVEKLNKFKSDLINSGVL